MQPKRRPKTFWIFACLASLAALGATLFAVQGEWAQAAGQLVVALLLASIPVRLAR